MILSDHQQSSMIFSDLSEGSKNENKYYCTNAWINSTKIQCVLLIPGQMRFYRVFWGNFDLIKRPLKLMPRP